MGKKSRKKNEKNVDHAALFHNGICLHCQKRKRLEGNVWCMKCIQNGRRIRESRQQRLSKAETLHVLNELEKELTEQPEVTE